jgi:neurotransmitter:Na+ symporter, NSS family
MGFVLAAAGSAVGLGNIWGFPTKVGANGGAAFVLLYLVCVALICAPILVAELAIGRRAQKDPVTAFR